MYSEFKRTFQTLDILALAVYAATASLISIRFSEYHFMTQFLTTTLILSLEYYFIEILPDLNRETKTSLQIVILFLISFELIPQIFGALFAAAIFLTILIPFRRLDLVSATLSSHLADIVSTVLVLPRGSELNPLANRFIDSSGVIPGLFLLKFLFVVLPVLWARRNLNPKELEFFLKLVFMIGFSMAVRNFTLWLS